MSSFGEGCGFNQTNSNQDPSNLMKYSKEELLELISETQDRLKTVDDDIDTLRRVRRIYERDMRRQEEVKRNSEN